MNLMHNVKKITKYSIIEKNISWVWLPLEWGQEFIQRKNHFIFNIFYIVRKINGIYAIKMKQQKRYITLTFI